MTAWLARYPYRAETRKRVDPRDVDPAIYSHHASEGIKPGVRLWGFKTKAGRDKFVKDYKAKKVKRDSHET